MIPLTRAALFGFLACVLATTACGGSAPMEEEVDGGAPVETVAAPDAAAVAVASRLAGRLGGDVTLVPTVRGLAEISYTQPQARREQDLIITSMRVKNVSENAIAGFRVDEFWFDAAGNTVTGDTFRIRAPFLTGQVLDVELRVPRDPAMDRSNYEFTHQNGDIKAVLADEIEAPAEEPAEDEETQEEPSSEP